MPIPIGLAAGGLGAVVAQGMRWFFLAYGAATVTRLFTALGIAWGTYEFVLQPAMDLADTYWSAMPAELLVWLRAFGVMEAASIVVSAYALWGLKRLFLRKS